MTFAKRTFHIAGIYGIAVLLPHYFLEGRIGRDMPPPITHPEFFYGFVGVGLAWQVLFLMLANDPVRFRPMMIPAILEKGLFGVAVLTLIALGRVAPLMLGAAVIDLAFAALFFLSYRKTAPGLSPSPSR